jgi:hypothetical protein
MLIVKELIEQLQTMPQDAPVYVYADHGQTHEQASGPSLEYTEEYEYYAELAWDEEGENLDTTQKPIVTIG